MNERRSWAHVIAFATLAGVTCSAGTVLTATAAHAAAEAAPAAPPSAGVGSLPGLLAWGVQPMAGSPNPASKPAASVATGAGTAAGSGAAAPSTAQPWGPLIGAQTSGGATTPPGSVPGPGTRPPAATWTPVQPTLPGPSVPARPSTTVPVRPSTVPARPSTPAALAPTLGPAPSARATTTPVGVTPAPLGLPPIPTPVRVATVTPPAVPAAPSTTTTLVAPTLTAPTQAPAVQPPAVQSAPAAAAPTSSLAPPNVTYPAPVAPTLTAPTLAPTVPPPGDTVVTTSGPATVTVAAPSGQAAGQPLSITINLNVPTSGWSVAAQPTAAPVTTPPPVPQPVQNPTVQNPTVPAPNTTPPVPTQAPAPGQGSGGTQAPVAPTSTGQAPFGSQVTPTGQAPQGTAPTAAQPTFAAPTGQGQTGQGQTGQGQTGQGQAGQGQAGQGQGQGGTRQGRHSPTGGGASGGQGSGDGRPQGGSSTAAPATSSGWFTPTVQPTPAGSGQPSAQAAPSSPATGASTVSVGGFHGWTSGASGDEAIDGSFNSWRGSPVGIIGTWGDTDAAEQTEDRALNQLSQWNGDIDIAVAGTVLNSDESYAQAAQGAYQARWTQMAQNLQKYRGDKPGITYVRPFHEFNGDWYKAWQVTPDRVADYKASFIQMVKTIRQYCPSCKIVWSPNNGTSSGSASIDEAYPGDEWVDVVGVDSYNANGGTIVTSAAAWNDYATATSGSNPVGPEAWRQWAEKHGKPISFPEWGLNHGYGGGDDPAYIQGMHDWMTQHAAQQGDASVAGKVVYDVYFNINMDGNTGFKIYNGQNPESASLYKSLTWGNGDGTTSRTATAQQGVQPQQGVPSLQAQGLPAAQPATGSQVMDARLGPIGVTAEAETHKALPYATTSNLQTLDLFLPKRTGSAVPLVIDIHGGAFNSGDSTDGDVTANIQPLLDKGYAVASINYRLNNVPFPAGLQDAKASVRWLRAHAAEYGIDPNRFAAWGASAGSYLAVMLGVTSGQVNATLDDATLGNAGVSSSVQAVVDWYGPVDFRQMDTQLGQTCGPADQSHNAADSPESTWLGAPVQQAANADFANAVTWIASAPAGTLPAFLIDHGGADCTVPVGQSQELAAALQAAGASVELNVIPGVGHEPAQINDGQLQASVAFVVQKLGSISSPALGSGLGAVVPAPVAVPTMNGTPITQAQPAAGNGAATAPAASSTEQAPPVTSSGS